MDMVRHGNENVIIADRLQRWARNCCRCARAARCRPPSSAEIENQFMVPQVAIKVWDVDSRYGQEAFAEGVSEDAKSFASSLTAARIAASIPASRRSTGSRTAPRAVAALMPLRDGAVNTAEPAFGMLVLASPDPQRFQSGMGTDFLERHRRTGERRAVAPAARLTP
jgi:uncharacterized protein YigA (DUF484 family)